MNCLCPFFVKFVFILKPCDALTVRVSHCELFFLQAYGFCRREKSCPLSHDVDDILDRERKVKEVKRQKRKRKHRTTSGNYDNNYNGNHNYHHHRHHHYDCKNHNNNNDEI